MWIHIPQSAELEGTAAFARFRMPTFVILSVFFLFSSQHAHPARRIGAYALSRLRILYLPFIAWAAIYFGYGVLLHLLLRGPAPAISLQFPITGQTGHLWFLPFILAAGVIMFPLAQRWHGLQQRLVWIIAGVTLAGLLAAGIATPLASYCLSNIHMKSSSAQDMLHRAITLVPCLPLGLGVYFLFRLTREHSEQWRKRMAIAGLVLVAGCAWYNSLRPTNALLEAIAGMGMVLIAFWPARHPVLLWLSRLGRYSYGMYLVHMIFVDFFKTLRTAVLHLAPSWWYDLLTLASCVLLSLAAAVVLSRFRWTRWLIAASPREKGRQKQVQLA